MCTNDTGNFFYIWSMKIKESKAETLFDQDKLVPGQSIDCVIIGFENNELKVLIQKLMNLNKWVVPGGFIFKDEGMDHAAIRILKERTGIDLPFLEQFKTFGDTDRRKKAESMKVYKSFNISGPALDWLQQRFITTGYLSLVDINKCSIQSDSLSDESKWVSLDKIPQLLFDHNQIVDSAIDYLKNQLNYLPVGIEMLPKKFTIKELQNLYESILKKPLDRGNFQRKILKLDILVRHEKHLAGGAHKAPFLYSFDHEKYNKLLEQGFGFNS